MSWVDDITIGVWKRLVQYVTEFFGDIVRGFVPPLAEHEAPIRALIGKVLFLTGSTKIRIESELQSERLTELSTMATYPPDVDALASLVMHGDDKKEYLEHLAKIQGKFPSVFGAYWELARQRPDFGALRELYNRGIVTADYVTKLLKESGFVDEVAKFIPKGGADEWDKFRFEMQERGDRSFMLNLFLVVPELRDIIAMEVRDAFPKDPREHPAELQGLPEFQEWAREQGAAPEVYQWEPGGEKDITEALKQGTTYGYQSFASWFLGARQQYTLTYEKAARAKGLDPYWSMKYWEAHWVIPGVALLRDLLHRTKKMTPDMAAQMLRWQDYPPGLVEDIVRVLYRPLTRVDVRRMHLRGVLAVPGVFKAYLDFGYAPENAANMTAFTVLWNMERNYGSILKELLASYSEGAIAESEALAQMWALIGSAVPESLPEWAMEALTPGQRQAVFETYTRIIAQKKAWIVEQLAMARIQRDIDLQRGRIETARKHYIGWVYTASEVHAYLTRHDFSAVRVNALLEQWQPERDRNERLPTRGMLEDFLIEEGMPVEEWEKHMRRLGYSAASIRWILDGVGRLPTAGMLERFLVNSVIKVDAFKGYMHKLGYDQWTVERLLAALLVEKREAEEE